jgi:hypothetical protein
MAGGYTPRQRAIFVVFVAWILSLTTTLVIFYAVLPIRTGQISTNAVTSDKIADGAVITTKLADGSVTSAQILNGTIIAADISDGSIISAKIADGAVTSSRIANGTITTADIADNAIMTMKLANGSVTSAKILAGSVTAVNLASNTITSIKIADGAVTDTKLASGAIPYDATFSPGLSLGTSSTTWQDIPMGPSLEITINRRSNLVIMFNSAAYIDIAGDWLTVRALVNETSANPDRTYLTSAVQIEAGSNSALFYLNSVYPGKYVVRIQYSMVSGTSTGYLRDRILIVMAVPA